MVPSLLALLALLQAPGRITFDTDLGLALNPVHLLSRAFHLWSAEAGFGGVGDQTYGFLFPMGPFFALGHLAGLPEWLTQRLWCGLVLVVAYEGARRLTHRMVSPHLLVGVLAGLAWALSPRMLTVVGPFSFEALPVALAPWLLLPLVTYLAHDVRKAAWLSGLVVLFLGAVNAGATLAVLPIPLLYLATRTTSVRTRLRSIAWWSAAVVLGSLWWAGPLLLLASFSPPFTDWVESARTTTDPVSALAALRDVTDWVAYVPAGTQGHWPAAWDLATTEGLALATTAVAVLGVAGLTSRWLPERRFLVLTALLGFTLLTLGHAGSPGSPFDAAFRDLLDGPAVPFRNVYKFDPVLHLPLVLGFAHLLHRAVTVTWPRPLRLLRPVSLALAAALLGVCAVPAFQGDLRPGPGFAAVPSWWTQAADYLARDGVAGRTLVVPEATAGRYTWGRTIGEPLEALATSPWAVRNQVPLTQAGNTRLVDAIEAVLASGRGSTALADVLARSGVGQLLVRNDLDRAAADALPPVRVRQALHRSPGLTLTKTFGPHQRFEPGASRVDGGIDIAPPALEVWTVHRAVAGPHAVPLSEVAALGGGPEDLVSLLEAGVVAPGQATVLGAQAPKGTWTGPRVITDGLQRREISFGRVHANTGPLLTAHEDYRQVRAAHDLLPFDAEGLQPVAAYDGLAGVTASSSAGYPDNFGGVRLSAQPSAALDANSVTAWRSGSLTAPVGQWLEVRRTRATDADTVKVSLIDQPLFGPAITSLRLSTDAGSVVVPVAGTEEAQLLNLPRGPWKRLRITVASVAGNSPRFGVVGIREVTLPGLTPTRTVVAPSKLPAGSAAPVVSFRAQEPTEPCVQLRTQRCDPGSAVPGEEAAALDRTFTLPQAATYQLNGTVLPSSGPGLARLLQPLGNALNAYASSSLDGGGAVGAAAAVDGDTRTSWVANPAERLPALAVSWPTPHVISRLRLIHARQPATSAPRLVHIHSTRGDREVPVGADGVARFAPLRVRSVTLTFPEVRPELSTSSDSELTGRLPVGVAEVRVPQVPTTARPLPDAAPTGSVCGFGPTVTIDGTRHATRVSGTLADLRTSSPLGLTLCGPTQLLPLSSGTHRMRIEATGEFQVRTAVLTPTEDVAPADVARTVTVRHFDATHRQLVVAPGAPSLLVVPEAANRGWRATLDGRRLASSVVDGWQQAWVLPKAGGTVHLDYVPDRPYRLSLLLGLLAALGLLALVVLSLRRSGPEPVVTPQPEPIRRGRVRTLVVTGLLALVCVAAGGPVCLAGLVVGALAVQLRRDRLVAPVTWLLVATAGVVVVLSSTTVPVAQSGSAAQLFCLFAVGLLASQLLRAPYPEPPTDDPGSSEEGAGRPRSDKNAVPLGPAPGARTI
ncbi:MAG: alpha-(1-_3)-arabinofuranosyltransferase family protein [Aeromicrobium sp.]